MTIKLRFFILYNIFILNLFVTIVINQVNGQETPLTDEDSKHTTSNETNLNKKVPKPPINQHFNGIKQFRNNVYNDFPPISYEIIHQILRDEDSDSSNRRDRKQYQFNWDKFTITSTGNDGSDKTNNRNTNSRTKRNSIIDNSPIEKIKIKNINSYNNNVVNISDKIFINNSRINSTKILDLTNHNLTKIFNLNILSNYSTELIEIFNLTNNKLLEFNLTNSLSFDQLKILDLTENNLNEFILNNNLLKSIKVLNLTGNQIKKFSTINELSINNNNSIPIKLKLKELSLRNNCIKTLDTINLTMLNDLEILDLSCNQIHKLDQQFLKQIKNIKYLNLGKNQFGNDLKLENFKNNENIEKLLSSNKNLNSTTNLTTLNDKPKTFKEPFCNLLNIDTLILSYNNIRFIDFDTFMEVPSLQYLDLSHNMIQGESIKSLQGIPDLVGLSIAYNPDLGDSLQEFVASWSLKELDISGTGLCRIPSALAQSVRILKLMNNWLSIIRCGDLDSYPLLQYLDLSYSHIDDIEEDALGRLEILETLFLDHNNLKHIPISLPTSLENLFLHQNQITEIQQQNFQGLHNLKILDLSNNKLLYLPGLPLPKLLTLNLQSSELKRLSQSVVKTSPKLRDLLLDDNPIKCSDLLGIAEWTSICYGENYENIRNTTVRKSIIHDFQQKSVYFPTFKESKKFQKRNSDTEADLNIEQIIPKCALPKINLKSKEIKLNETTNNFDENLKSPNHSILQKLNELIKQKDKIPLVKVFPNISNSSAEIMITEDSKTKLQQLNISNENISQKIELNGKNFPILSLSINNSDAEILEHKKPINKLNIENNIKNVLPLTTNPLKNSSLLRIEKNLMSPAFYASPLNSKDKDNENFQQLKITLNEINLSEMRRRKMYKNKRMRQDKKNIIKQSFVEMPTSATNFINRSIFISENESNLLNTTEPAIINFPFTKLNNKLSTRKFNKTDKVNSNNDLNNVNTKSNFNGGVNVNVIINENQKKSSTTMDQNHKIVDKQFFTTISNIKVSLQDEEKQQPQVHQILPIMLFQGSLLQKTKNPSRNIIPNERISTENHSNVKDLNYTSSSEEVIQLSNHLHENFKNSNLNTSIKFNKNQDFNINKKFPIIGNNNDIKFSKIKIENDHNEDNVAKMKIAENSNKIVDKTIRLIEIENVMSDQKNDLTNDNINNLYKSSQANNYNHYLNDNNRPENVKEKDPFNDFKKDTTEFIKLEHQHSENIYLFTKPPAISKTMTNQDNDRKLKFLTTNNLPVKKVESNPLSTSVNHNNRQIENHLKVNTENVHELNQHKIPNNLLDLKIINNHNQSNKTINSNHNYNSSKIDKRIYQYPKNNNVSSISNLKNINIDNSEHNKGLTAEPWLEIRLNNNTTGTSHPGLFIVIGLTLSLILLVGIIHIYRCHRKPWYYSQHNKQYINHHSLNDTEYIRHQQCNLNLNKRPNCTCYNLVSDQQTSTNNEEIYCCHCNDIDINNYYIEMTDQNLGKSLSSNQLSPIQSNRKNFIPLDLLRLPTKTNRMPKLSIDHSDANDLNGDILSVDKVNQNSSRRHW